MILRHDYKHLVQKPQLCSAATISMVALRRGRWIDQTELAKRMGLKLTRSGMKAFKDKELKGTNRILEAGYPVNRIRPEKLNKIFQELDFPVETEFHKLSEVKDPHSFVAKNLEEKNDVAVLYYLEGVGLKDKNWSHYSLISEYDTHKRMLEICDPGQRHKSFWKISLEMMLSGMGPQWDGLEKGFFVFKSFKQ